MGIPFVKIGPGTGASGVPLDPEGYAGYMAGELRDGASKPPNVAGQPNAVTDEHHKDATFNSSGLTGADGEPAVR